MSDVVAPIIHPNGDRAATLIANLEHAYKAVRAAMLALREIAGNKRNFYVEDGRWEAYREQHEARVAHLKAVESSVVEELKAIQAQQEKP